MSRNAVVAVGLSLMLVLGRVAGASPLELISRTQTDITGIDVRSVSLDDSFQSGQFVLSDGAMASRPPAGYGTDPVSGMPGRIAFNMPVDYHFAVNLYFVPPGTSMASMMHNSSGPFVNAPEIDIWGDLKGTLSSDGTVDIGLSAKSTNVQFAVSNSAKDALPQSLIDAFTDPSRVQVSAYIASWAPPTYAANGVFVDLSIAPPSPGDPHAVPEPSTCLAFVALTLGLVLRRRWATKAGAAE